MQCTEAGKSRCLHPDPALHYTGMAQVLPSLAAGPVHHYLGVLSWFRDVLLRGSNPGSRQAAANSEALAGCCI